MITNSGYSAFLEFSNAMNELQNATASSYESNFIDKLESFFDTKYFISKSPILSYTLLFFYIAKILIYSEILKFKYLINNELNND